jgi:hypothetical protein
MRLTRLFRSRGSTRPAARKAVRLSGRGVQKDPRLPLEQSRAIGEPWLSYCRWPGRRRAPSASGYRTNDAKALTALASVSALAMPAVAIAAAAPPDADAEILALRAEFVRLNDVYQPLNDAAWEKAEAFRDKFVESGFEAACEWAKATGCYYRDMALEQMSDELDEIVKRMIDLRPTTPGGIAAIAASLRDEALSSYWNEPVAERDCDVEVITRFLDALIEIGQTRAA